MERMDRVEIERRAMALGERMAAAIGKDDNITVIAAVLMSLLIECFKDNTPKAAFLAEMSCAWDHYSRVLSDGD